MNENTIDAEDQQLIYNLQKLNSELCFLIDDQQPLQIASCSKGGAVGSALQEFNPRVHELAFDSSAPLFEFHRFGCIESRLMGRRQILSSNTEHHKKPKSNAIQYASLLQKENISMELTMDQIKLIELFGNCRERNIVLRLMNLFKSLHDHLNADFPSDQLNSVPSDYVFELPSKHTKPKSLNLRHQVHVVCTKLDRFIGRLRRILESNRHFDYTKYVECDQLINGTAQSLRILKQFTNLEMRQRNLYLIGRLANENAAQMEIVMGDLQERLKSAHIHVYVFNWEMDLEHRYSATMTASLEEMNKNALALAAAESHVDQSRQFNFEEQLLAAQYQLRSVVSCAKEHEDFLTALLKSPENYFPPEIIDLCQPPKILNNIYLPPLPPVFIDELADGIENMVFGVDILGLAPSSPPRVNHRSHVPKCNRA
ncbi:hypothetical protein AWZ03_012654 [Drosophila navojoa]|uniref:Protein bag-of-marbles n=1 Tax=Drosophila navojoa TaxID=7232 RepID=A0A484AY48_DRONA|nr:protein bag-of-marbles [Drosophila navojoa]TDG40922.1 hypothetical protein AWZ03_012654 [Drosophila navojoa]